MFKFSKKMIYAVEAVVYVAVHGKQAPVQSRAITHLQNIPERYLEQVLQRLVRVGILKGVRGPRGGYRLSRSAERISVGEIVAVIRNMEGAEDGIAEDSGSDIGQKVVLPIFRALDTELMERLDRVSVAELAQNAVLPESAPIMARVMESA
ncbi:Rrf2 family transcriptional regulator [Iodidimonas muriae]|uniref:Rrf2 family transcriptional regulator n=1 Tax=Iodidimonas muriae TaxID=261467 RepID=A0ABQ2L856_9PROT|nr:Rrf2 family transcriptional regulator [Iodidimonas muriae]GER05722.1 Rrf2 family transcriptional regulator [Kordiimonadales bacterium JCM 17843]GGO06623.1 Rrf2 family transcriptional regulator [Iodidimonas muriae]